MSVQNGLKGRVENIRQVMNEISRVITQENHMLQESTGEQINRVNGGFDGSEGDTERRVANINCHGNEFVAQLLQVREGRGRSPDQCMVGSNSSHQQVTSGHTPPTSNVAVCGLSVRHENDRCVEEL